MAALIPPGLPGTITWKAKQLGMNPYFLAMSQSAAAGHDGKQGRYYMGLVMHDRLRSMARAAAATPHATF